MGIRTMILLTGLCCMQGQQAPLMSGVNSVTNGVHVAYRTVLEPAGSTGSPYKLSGGVISHRRGSAGQGVHRYVRTGESYFGYDIVTEQLNGGRDVRLQIVPLTLTPDEASRLLGASVRLGNLPTFPPPLVVSSGSTVEVEILRNVATGQRIVDILTVSAAAPEVAREWALRLVAPAITVGKLSTSSEATLTGDLISLDAPGQGRITLSLLALRSRGFQPVGEVEGGVLRFQMGGNTFQITSKSGIVPGGGRWKVYGRLVPKQVGNELVIGTSDL